EEGGIAEHRGDVHRDVPEETIERVAIVEDERLELGDVAQPLRLHGVAQAPPQGGASVVAEVDPVVAPQPFEQERNLDVLEALALLRGAGMARHATADAPGLPLHTPSLALRPGAVSSPRGSPPGARRGAPPPARRATPAAGRGAGRCQPVW